MLYIAKMCKLGDKIATKPIKIIIKLYKSTFSTSNLYMCVKVGIYMYPHGNS